MKRTLLLLVCLAFIAVISGCNSVPKDGIAKNFTLKDLNGISVSLDSYKGHVVLLAFFTTWCPSCQDEMPQLEKIYEKLRSREFEVLAVDLRDAKSEVKDFADSNNLTFTILLDEKGSVGTAYKVRYIPRIFIIDRAGKIAFSSQYMPMEQIEKELLKVL